MKLSSLAVFCGSRPGNDAQYAAAARELGTAMAARSVRLVYGGGRVGIMGIVADAVLASGGQATGVIPTFLQRLEVGHDGLDEVFVTDNMHERKRIMFEHADAFVALPGGIGTLDETIEILTWKQLSLHAKPVIILDTSGYWSALLAVFDSVVDQGFAGSSMHDLYDVVATPTALFELVDALPEPSAAARPDRV
ncbi:MAG: TIGR00730 family Rossman fold protein [Gammaproteobacteria bacterium]